MNVTEAALWTVVFGVTAFVISYVIIKVAVRSVRRRY